MCAAWTAYAQQTEAVELQKRAYRFQQLDRMQCSDSERVGWKDRSPEGWLDDYRCSPYLEILL